MQIHHSENLTRSQSLMGWRCGLVGVSEQGHERFETEDLAVIQWLKGELDEHLSQASGAQRGGDCYHLKGRGGIPQATQDLQCLLSSKKYPFVIRSDAKGYYAHIRHHKLVALLRQYRLGDVVCQVTTRLCQRMTVRCGLYSECQQGIPLGCAASPALAAIYLAPLDAAMQTIPGVKYLRYMDDWVILCPSRWKMRRAVRLMHQTLESLGLWVHPDKTFIGRVATGFDFLGVEFKEKKVRLSSVSIARLNENLTQKLSHAARLYEQGRLHTLGSIELYFTHWLRWAKGIGVTLHTALGHLISLLKKRCADSTNVMIQTFSNMLLITYLDKPNKQNEYTYIENTLDTAST